MRRSLVGYAFCRGWSCAASTSVDIGVAALLRINIDDFWCGFTATGNYD